MGSRSSRYILRGHCGCVVRCCAGIWHFEWNCRSTVHFSRQRETPGDGNPAPFFGSEEAIMLKAIVVLIALFVSTAIHAQPTSAWSQRNAYQPPKSAWKDSYQPPKSQWNSPKDYQSPKSAWSGSPQPPKRQVPESWWSDPNHQNTPTSSWSDR